MEFPCKATVLKSKRYPTLIGKTVIVTGEYRLLDWYRIKLPEKLEVSADIVDLGPMGWIAPVEALEFE